MPKSRPLLPLSTTAIFAAILTTFSACDFTPLPVSGNEDAPENADRFHEKSFSWDTPARTPALAKTAVRETRFETVEALGQAILDLDAGLQDAGISDSLWKPVDYACDELDLGLWNTYGTIRIRDSLVFDEELLKSRCTYIGGPGEVSPGDGNSAAGASLAKMSVDYGGKEVEHRVHPYKMIGRSWNNFDAYLYRSTGGETQFKKYRDKLFVTAWWDTEATRIGVKIHLLDCGMENNAQICRLGGTKIDWYRNDAYVSARDFTLGTSVEFIADGTFRSSKPIRLRVSDAVITLHSADHAGIAFRAMSSSGLQPGGRIVSLPALQYVTW
jgi:hypothetical protein